MHVTLAAVTSLAAFLHVWWLNHLRANTTLAVLFDVPAVVVVLTGLRRWVWLPLRAHGHRGVPFHAGQFAWLKVGWTGEAGRIDGRVLDRVLPRHARHYDYFLCGPPAMVAAVGQQLLDPRIPVRRIHTERFEVV